MLRTLLAVLVVLAVGAAGAGAYYTFVAVPERVAAATRGPGGGRGPGGPVPVEVVAVRTAPATTTVTAVGTLASNESSILRPEVSGRITKIQFEEGSSVKRGEILVKLDDDVETAEVARAEAASELARANIERARELRRTNAGTQRALDEAEAEVGRTRAELQLAQAQLAKRWIKAAFDAQTGLRLFSLGDYVNTGQDLVNLEQIDPLKVDFRVPELFLSSLREKQQVEIGVDAFPGEAFTGEVFAINPLIDATGRAIVIRARIANVNAKLRPGLFARVTLTLSERAEALWVPEEAIVPQGDTHMVFKVVSKGDGPPVAERAVVVLGKRLPGSVEVRSGLSHEDRVVAAGVMKVRDGVPLAPIQPPPLGAPAAAPGAGAPAGPAAGAPTAERARVAG